MRQPINEFHLLLAPRRIVDFLRFRSVWPTWPTWSLRVSLRPKRTPSRTTRIAVESLHAKNKQYNGSIQRHRANKKYRKTFYFDQNMCAATFWIIRTLYDELRVHVMSGSAQHLPSDAPNSQPNRRRLPDERTMILYYILWSKGSTRNFVRANIAQRMEHARMNIG